MIDEEEFSTQVQSLLGGAKGAEVWDKVKEYEKMLYKYSDRLNLISKGDREKIAIRHIWPALLMSRPLSAMPNSTVLDMGSGSGIPGIPLKIVMDKSTFVLVESRRKRANFLREVIRRLDLKGIEVINKRVEKWDEGRQWAEVVVSRAVKRPEDLIELVGPCLKSYGVLLLSLAPDWHGEPAVWQGEYSWGRKGIEKWRLGCFLK